MTHSFEIITPSSGSTARPARGITLDMARRRDRDPFGPYVLSTQLATTINVALALDQPLLVTGDPGCGKTALAWAVAGQLGCKVLEFHTKSTSTARDLLYQVDSLTRFHDANARDPKATDANHYIEYRALGEAIQSPTTTVVLIDEIDKAPRDFPNDLLNELDRMAFEVSDVKPRRTFHARAKHFVLITSNSERRLPLPFLRRCVYARIEFPSSEMLAKIVELHCGPLPRSFATLAVERFLELRRTEGLTKPPATSELISWVVILRQMGVSEHDLSLLQKDRLPALETLIKMDDDRKAIGVR